MGKRVRAAFDQVLAQAAAVFPWLTKARVQFCEIADRDHKKKWRQFAHSNHKKLMVCFAKAAERELTDTELRGMIAHELGHLVALALQLPAHMSEDTGPRHHKTPKAVQDEADWVARELLGIQIRYNRRTLQDVA